MKAKVDERRRVVRAGGSEWPFRLDLRRGNAILEAAVNWRVRPQRWDEKRRLAQFAHWGEEFVREQLWSMCVQPRNARAAGEELEAVLGLAAWLSCGGSHHGYDPIPLDAATLTQVTTAVCRALGVAPAALDALPAYEVESLWRTAAAQSSGPVDAQDPAEYEHKIIVLPDPPAPEEAPSAQTSGAISSLRAPEPVGRPAPRAAQTPRAAVSHSPAGSLPVEPAPGASSATGTPSAYAPQPARSRNPQPLAYVRAADPLTPTPVETLGAQSSSTASIAQPPSPPMQTNPRFPLHTQGSRFRVVLGPAAQAAPAANPPKFSVTEPTAVPLTPVPQPQTLPSADVPHSEWSKPEWIAPPFAPPPERDSPAHPVSFDEFAAEFGDRLQSAASDLGIFEER